MSLTFTTALDLEHCCACGVPFGMPTGMVHQRREDHKLFYCPNGHSQHYTGKTEAEKQRERADRLERRLANKDEDLRATRASLTATKGQLTKTKRRVARGVCPCCTRHFVNVERHVANQHPEYLEEAKQS
jgi:hypothetical protein